MDKIKLYLLNYRYFSLRFFRVSLLRNIQSVNGLIVTGRRTSISFAKGACLSIREGIFFFNKSPRIEEKFIGCLELGKASLMTVRNTFQIYPGCHIILLPNSKLTLGSGYINRGLKIRCYQEIEIGDNVAISEDVTIRDSDAHCVNRKESEMTIPVSIGNNVWIGNNVTILKGVQIGDGAIIAAGAVVNKSIPENCLAAGVPAKVVRRGVSWQ